MAEQGSPTVLLLSNSGVERALWGKPGDGRRRERAGVGVLAAVAAVRRAVRGGRGVARVAPGGLVEGHRL